MLPNANGYRRGFWNTVSRFIVAALLTLGLALVAFAQFGGATALAKSSAAPSVAGDENWDNRFGGDSGFDGPVSVVAVMGSDVYAGGFFHSVAGVTVNGIARWDGTSWHSLRTGLGGGAYGFPGATSLYVNGASLYVGGEFTQAGSVAANHIARWDSGSSTWSALGAGIAADNGAVLRQGVFALTMIGSNLYAGGEFFAAGGVSVNNIARWDGSAWHSLGVGASEGANNDVLALAAYSNALLIGGRFTQAGGLSSTALAFYDLATDSWSAFPGAPPDRGGGNIGQVYALQVNNSDLYVGGVFVTAGNVTLNNIGRWDGSAWHALGGGTNSTVLTLGLLNNLLFVGGEFGTAGGSVVNGIAKWNISSDSWSALGSGVDLVGSAQKQAKGSGLQPNGEFFPEVASLAVSGSAVNVGGQFNYAGAKPANDFSIWHEQSAAPTATATAQPTGTPGCGLGFSDVASSDYFFEPVHYLVCHGVISGYDDHTFRPFNDTTRGQMAKIVVLGFGVPIYTPTTATFNDVPTTDKFFTWVESAAKAGIISGYADHIFHRERSVTRGQLSKMVAIAAKWTLVSPQQQHFSDVAPSNTFYSYIETAYAHGVISGYNNGMFLPSNPASRAATTKIVYLAIMAAK